ncbi:MAG: peptidoglycan-binding protein [Pyrinomonadaceae bacterium]|nr:peptidoglycan-binding protein [Pyrinomonadaceae bacterium]
MFRRSLILAAAMFVFASIGLAQGTSTGSTAPAASTEKPKKAPVFRSTKDQVKQAQTMLKSKNMFSGDATGSSSPEWKTAVKAYQEGNGLTKTGSLNRATLEKMGIELTDKQKTIPVNPAHLASSSDEAKPAKSKEKSTASTSAKSEAKSTDGPKRPAPFRAGVDQIKAAQKVLRDGKMLTGGEDGKLDDMTREGLGKYQEANGLKVSKTLNASTLEKMGIALTDKQKEQVAAQAAYDAAKAPKN